MAAMSTATPCRDTVQHRVWCGDGDGYGGSGRRGSRDSLVLGTGSRSDGHTRPNPKSQLHLPFSTATWGKQPRIQITYDGTGRHAVEEKKAWRNNVWPAH